MTVGLAEPHPIQIEGINGKPNGSIQVNEDCARDEQCAAGVCVASMLAYEGLGVCTPLAGMRMKCMRDGECENNLRCKSGCPALPCWDDEKANTCCLPDALTSECRFEPGSQGVGSFCFESSDCIESICEASECVSCEHDGGWNVCDDNDVCTGEETCVPSVGCQSGVPLDCDDGIPCSWDHCENPYGCRNDLSACECFVAGDSTCPDTGNVCTENVCTDALLCEIRAVPDGRVCGGLDPCVVSPVCKGGKCVGEPLDPCP